MGTTRNESRERRFRLGVDIGGTFTDATLIEERTGRVRSAKVLTTPQDPADGFLHAIQRILKDAAAGPESVEYIVHATTVATNAIIEGKAARTGFITTKGFRDLFEIARQMRPSLYDLRFVKPRPLVPRHLCFEVSERLDARGEVVAALDEDDVRRVARRLRAAGVDAIAVCLLHAYLNPQHELQVQEILNEVFPDAIVSLSSNVCPEFREYFRASTTVINASVRPIVSRYLTKIESRLADRALDSQLLVMQSNGGVYGADSARENPVYMVESGPAAGVIAASFIGSSLGYRDIMSFDMGGTTAKAGLVQDGEPRITKDYEVGGTAHATIGEGRGSGYPIRTPVIDLVEIGAGGGSIAWVDSGGSLRVGPQSAGADPGPASYMLGGTRPTVTDANLVLGRLNPEYFLGGEMRLNVAAATEAIERHCAGPLGMTTVETALSIVEIANASMINALRLVSVRRGYDPRGFALIAFGGAGPAHANRLAAENEIATTIVPPSPGITSSMGLLATDLKHEYTTPFPDSASGRFPADIDATFAALESEGRAELEREGVHADSAHFLRSLDVRYIGQSYELTMRTTESTPAEDGFGDLERRFHDEHDRAYGFNSPGDRIEIVAARMTAVGRIEKPKIAQIARAKSTDAGQAVKHYQPAYFGELSEFVDCPVYDRYRFRSGMLVHGPAIVEESDSTTVIHPGYQAVTTETGFLIITKTDHVAADGTDATARDRVIAADTGGDRA